MNLLSRLVSVHQRLGYESFELLPGWKAIRWGRISRVHSGVGMCRGSQEDVIAAVEFEWTEMGFGFEHSGSPRV